MNMKKVFLLTLAVIMTVCLFAGCGQQAVTEQGETLTMATNAAFPPYEFYENETIVGIDAEIAGKIAEKLGMKLEIIDTEFGSIVAGVQTGKYDMGMAGMTVTEERKASVDFTTS